MIATDVSKVIFEGNGVATQFPFNFKVWDTTQLIVQITDTKLTTTTVNNWTATLTSSGGTITYLHHGSALPEGYKLAILRNMPFLQEVDLISGTRFDPQVIEDALDKATAERQQLYEAISRTVKIASTSNDPPEIVSEEIFQARDEALSAADKAQATASKAESYVNQLHNLNVIAQTLPPQYPASAHYDVESGTMTLDIPQGPQGPQGIAGRDGYPPSMDIINCGGAWLTHLTIINAGNASSFGG